MYYINNEMIFLFTYIILIRLIFKSNQPLLGKYFLFKRDINPFNFYLFCPANQPRSSRKSIILHLFSLTKSANIYFKSS